MQVIILPAGSGSARVHYEKTIEKKVPLDRIRGLVDETIAAQLAQEGEDGFSVWGFVPGEGGRNIVRWNKIESGSIALFGGEGRVKSVGQVAWKTRAPQLAEALWGRDDSGQTWEYIIFLKRVEKLEVSYKALNEAAGFKPDYFIRSFEVLNEERSANVVRHLQGWLHREEGSNTMQAAFERLLQSFVQIRTTTSYGTQADLWGIMDSLMFGIKAIPQILLEPRRRQLGARALGSDSRQEGDDFHGARSLLCSLIQRGHVRCLSVPKSGNHSSIEGTPQVRSLL
jgi:hypothetical protein